MKDKVMMALIVIAVIILVIVANVGGAYIGHPVAEWAVCEILGFDNVCTR